jgi:hypothetical protein
MSLMTGAQASYLKTLAEEVGEPDAYDGALTRQQLQSASKH